MKIELVEIDFKLHFCIKLNRVTTFFNQFFRFFLHYLQSIFSRNSSHKGGPNPF